MSDPKPTAPKADALANKLKASLAQRRPRPWKLVLATLAASVLLLVLLAWWMYPGPKPAPLQIIALDVVCPRGEAPNALAQLFAPPEGKEPRGWSGYTVVFHEQRLLLAPGVQPLEVVVKSDKQGQASVEWPVDDQELAEFLVLHVDAEQRQGSTHERGRIYVWPKDAPLLIVDADQTLIAEELDAQASDTLTKAAQKSLRIVYLSLASAQAHEFRTARGWIEKQASLPKGPVLGRKHFSGEETVEEARHDLLKDLRGRFEGTMFAVVKNAESAQVCKALGLRTIVVGVAAAPAKVHAPTWADVPAKLK